MKDRKAWRATVHGLAELDKPEQLNNNKRRTLNKKVIKKKIKKTTIKLLKETIRELYDLEVGKDSSQKTKSTNHKKKIDWIS